MSCESIFILFEWIIPIKTSSDIEIKCPTYLRNFLIFKEIGKTGNLWRLLIIQKSYLSSVNAAVIYFFNNTNFR